jgi:general secretion pathway protein L
LTATASQQPIARSGADTRLRHFLRQWKSSLLAGMPNWLRALGSDVDQHWQMEIADGQLYCRGRDGARHPFEQIDARQRAELASANSRIELSVPQEMTLRTELPLPAVSASLLADVVRHLLPRHTPFDAQNAHYAYRTSSDSADRQRRLELLLLPKTQLADAREQLARAGIQLDRIGVTDSDAAVAELDLLAADDPLRRQRRGSWLRRLLLAGAAALLLVNIALPFYQQSQQIAALQAQIDTLENDASAARKLPTEINAIEQRAEFMRQQQADALDALSMLDALTLALPDDSWLQRLQVGGGKLEIIGESTNASLLLERLQAAPQFAEPNFSRAVVRNPRSGRERFTISARIAAANSGQSEAAQ